MDEDAPQLPADRYHVADLLGEGGMARVWRAWHVEKGGWCAIKVLREQYRTVDRARDRFLEEGRTIAKVRHRNVIEAWEAVDGPAPYIVLEVADAGSLHDWVRKHGSMPPRMAVEIGVQICKGVGAAHRLGVVHRDVKPHNVLVNRKGTCKVSDFGIAKLHRTDDAATVPDATTHHEAMGTLGYMAPEQRSDPRAADARVDVYGVGATLFTLLTGRVVTNLFKAIEDDPHTLADIPVALVPILAKATAYKPEARHATVEQLAKELHAVWSELPSEAPSTPTLTVDVAPEPAPPAGVAVRAPSPSSLPPTNLFAEPSLDDLVPSRTETPVPPRTPHGPRKLATTAPPPDLRWSHQDDTMDEPPPKTRPWFVGAALLGMALALPSLPAAWVRAAASEAEGARHAFTATVLDELAVVDELGQLGADRPALEALATDYRQAPDLPSAVSAADRYVAALELAEQTFAVGKNDRTAALVVSQVGRIRDQRDGWLGAVDLWRSRAGAFPGSVAVMLHLAPAPAPLPPR